MGSKIKKKVDDPSDLAVNINELCRLCLAREETMVPIFDGDDDDVPIPLRLMACVNIEAYKGDGLPTMICKLCKHQLDKAYQFKKKSEDAHTKLQKHMKLVQKLDKIDTADSNEDSESYSLSGKSRESNQNNSNSVSFEDHQSIDDPTEAPEEGCEDNYEPKMKTKLMDLGSMKKESSNIILMTSEEYDEMVESQRTAANSNKKNVYMMEVTGHSTGDSESMKLQPVEENVDDDNDEIKVFKCDKCPKAFTRLMMLKSHQSVHSTQRGVTCQACEKWFPTRSALIRHERTHTGEKPFGCNICNRAFAQKEILLRHLMTHSGQKPYQCQDCDKSFTQRESLRVHMRRHQKLDPNEIQLHHCQLCPKAFCHASGLSRHLVTHTGRTYKCVTCEKSFTDRSSLLRHSRIHAL